MSTDGSIDSATIEKTKQQIRGLVQEISQLSRSEMDPEQYYAEVLHRIVTALAASGGAIWTIDAERRLRLDFQINIQPSIVDPDNDDSQRHFRLMQEVISKGEPRLVPPMSGAGEPGTPGNPTNTLLVLAPLETDDAVEGVIEVFQRADSNPSSQQGYLRFLVQMSQHVGDFLKSRKLKTFSDRQSFWAKINGFSKDVHDSLDVGETAYTVANEGRRLIECDRVTVTTTKAGTQVVRSVSGQDTIDVRSNMVSLMQTLASKVCATGEPLWYNGKMDDFPPQVEHALEAYVDESHTKSLAIIPLRKADLLKAKSSDELGTEVQTKYQANAGEVIGSIVVEQIDSTQARDLINPRIEEVAQQSARALGNAMEHNDLFMMPVWRTIGKSRALTTAKNLPKTLLISGLILFVILSLFIMRKDFELKAEGTMEPVIQQHVFIHEDGNVVEVTKDHGAHVKKGEVLLRLESQQIEAELTKSETDLKLIDIRLGHAVRIKSAPQSQRSRQDSTNDNILLLQSEKFALTQQIALLKAKKKMLNVTAPIDGQIVTWDVKTSLAHRPVARGQEVMTVADPDGDFRLEVFLPDKRYGYLRRAANELKAKDPDAKLEVSFVLKSNPDVQHTGFVESIQAAAEYNEQHGQSLRMFVSFEKKEVEEKIKKKVKQGTEVIAKVECGRAPLGYCWFYELYDWIRIQLFSI